MREKRMRLLDLFSGIGGFAKGIEQAGIKIEEHYYSEIDKYAEAIYRRHYSGAQPLGAVADVWGGDYEPFDLITFGFPCQDISVAGKRKGIQGTRSNLFFEATRIIRENKPRAFIFENVKGLFSSNGGKDFIAVLREIADIGLYECQWQLLNTSWFLPQNRERIYFIGCLTGAGTRQIFPIGEDGGEYDKGLMQIGSIDTKGHNSIWGRVCDSQGVATNLNSEAGDPSFTLTGQDQHGVMIANPVQLEHSKDAWASQYGTNIGEGNAFTIRSENPNGVMIARRIRRLTPIECARLQGFSDDWCEWGIDENGDRMDISDTQQYKCYGNAVSTVVVEAIMKKWNL